MKTLYLMCGLAFAGKTTFAHLMAKRTNARVISLDDINEERDLHGGLGIPANEWTETHRMALQQMNSLIPRGQDIIIDDTNCFRWLRDAYRTQAAEHGYRTVVVFVDIPLDLALQRASLNYQNEMRPVVLPAVLMELAGKFEPPDQDEDVLVCTASEPAVDWVNRHFPR